MIARIPNLVELSLPVLHGLLHCRVDDRDADKKTPIFRRHIAGLINVYSYMLFVLTA